MGTSTFLPTQVFAVSGETSGTVSRHSSRRFIATAQSGLNCHENGGRGWTATIVGFAAGAATVRFTDATDARGMPYEDAVYKYRTRSGRRRADLEFHQDGEIDDPDLAFVIGRDDFG